VTRVDWIALAVAALAALSGLRRGLVATALSLAGLALGALIGARLAPHLLHNGASSPYTPGRSLAARWRSSRRFACSTPSAVSLRERCSVS
jgi:hypothetical protein